jgi:hypothetical protein
LFDIVGTLTFSEPMSDVEVEQLLDGIVHDSSTNLQARAIDAYDPFSGVYRILDKHFLEPPKTESQRQAVARAWKTLVLQHPKAYLYHRWSAFREILQLPERDTPWIWVGFSQYESGPAFDYKPGPFQSKLQRWEFRIGMSWLMYPYVYLYLLLGLFLLTIKFRDRLNIALAASGIISEITLFLIAPTPDLRYSIWLIICTPLVIVLLFAKRLESGQPPLQPEVGAEVPVGSSQLR